MLKNNKDKKIIVANWKMNPESLDSAKKIFLSIRKVAESLKRTQVVVCPPFLYVSDLIKLKRRKVFVGVQNSHFEYSGSFTGEISPQMVYKMDGSHVILGHSERRAMGESDEDVNKKLKMVINNDLTAIVCVGEKERDGEGKYLEVIKNQIVKSIGGIQKRNLDQLVVAYEPVWAVGQKNYVAMSPRDLHETSLFIRKVLADIFGKDWISRIPILYGGSVNLENAESILFEGEVQGLLVGRQSLNPKEFGEILKIADKK